MKISTFMVAMVAVCVVIAGFWLLASDMNDTYSPTSYDDEFFQDFNRSIYKINKTGGALKEDLETLTAEDTGVFDKIGAFFGAGFGAFRTSFGSLNIFWTISNTLTSKIGIHPILLAGISSVIVILLFVGIFLSTLMKREL